MLQIKADGSSEDEPDNNDGDTQRSGTFDIGGMKGSYSTDGKGNRAWSAVSKGGGEINPTIGHGSSGSPFDSMGSFLPFRSNTNRRNVKSVSNDEENANNGGSRSGPLNIGGMRGTYSTDGKGNMAWSGVSDGRDNGRISTGSRSFSDLFGNFDDFFKDFGFRR